MPTAAPPPDCVGLATATADGEQPQPVRPHNHMAESPCGPEQYAVTAEVLVFRGRDLDLTDSGHDCALINDHAAVIWHRRVDNHRQGQQHWHGVGGAAPSRLWLTRWPANAPYTPSTGRSTATVRPYPVTSPSRSWSQLRTKPSIASASPNPSTGWVTRGAATSGFALPPPTGRG